MEIFFALQGLCEGSPRVTGGFLSQRPMTRSFAISFGLRLIKRSNGLANNRDVGDSRRHRDDHYDVIVMLMIHNSRDTHVLALIRLTTD